MRVLVKKMDVDMKLKNSGIEFEVRTPTSDEHLGDIIINKAGMTWCQGRTKATSGKFKKWDDLIIFFNS